ncbi:MAG: hypothetical protein HQL76_06940 [Magnetococcales bacterium]|nr:hypothetical protein [Magnetococcales bacterium]
MNGNGIFRERERNRLIYDKVSSWKRDQEKAVQRVRGLPVRLRTQGLVMVVADLIRGGDPCDDRMLEILAEGLLGRTPSSNFLDLLKECIEADRGGYLKMQHEAMVLMEQTKVLAEALWANQKAK